MGKTAKYLTPVAVAVILALLPTPEGLTTTAHYFFALFLGVIVGLIVEPIPPALIGLIGVSIAASLGLVAESPKESAVWALSGFSNTVIWLIFTAFMFALGYKKSGLGKRIALMLIQRLGKTPLGLGYAIALADGVLSPFMPSNTARSAGTLYPVAINIPQMFNSLPDHEPRKIGSYIAWVAMASTTVTSSLFVTAMAPNLLAISLVEKGTGLVITWQSWFYTMALVMIPLLLLVPLLTYIIYPPTQKSSPDAPDWARKELAKMSGVTRNEWLMLGLGLLALVLWIFGQAIGIDSTVAALLVLCLLVLSGVVTWDDIIGNTAAFNVLIWFATLVAMATGLRKVGFLDWSADLAAQALTNLAPMHVALTLLVLFFVFHYFFASVTAHIVALLPLFLEVANSLLPVSMVHALAYLLVGTMGVMGIITPYATGPSPVWYGSGYISQSAWWGLGAIFGGIYLGGLVILGLFTL
ncbi:DASS family sodium-coupled anion symporter [Parendozoicomonas haliclonae]|uniref:L-tartrate/succinate antiporter n=1 Tax=Parendozoicomonas haliclonae TaxID=1960125 RepID=A0A1X7AJR9_9GAMM|nr:DASS family sodium-coupled anion symporter [Parendozoicomonas haliclonae]SMA47124.1 L-tartrate/succinate antiporter [Parendozoicomonas haliclonae]